MEEKQNTEMNLSALRKELEEIRDFHLSRWEYLPDIDLYMDQVIGYVDKQLAVLKNGEERLLTNSMVNNYVKYGTIPKPKGKKYTRSHIARLMPICVLKSVMPLTTVSAGIEDVRALLPSSEAYDRYCKSQEDALHRAAARALSAFEGEERSGEERLNELEFIAFGLAVEAAAHRAVVERIFDYVKKERASAVQEEGRRHGTEGKK